MSVCLVFRTPNDSHGSQEKTPALQSLGLHFSLPSSPTICTLAHRARATWPPLASGPLHVLFPLPGAALPRLTLPLSLYQASLTPALIRLPAPPFPLPPGDSAIPTGREGNQVRGWPCRGVARGSRGGGESRESAARACAATRRCVRGARSPLWRMPGPQRAPQPARPRPHSLGHVLMDAPQ